jgi:microcystin-dependent protein
MTTALDLARHDALLNPVGMVADFAGASAPTGWLLCAGQNVSRTTHAALFAAIGTTYGVGDGSTTFGLPDLRGRVVAGKDNMGGTSADRLTSPINGDVLGASGGSQSHALVTGELPAHNHGVSDPGHVHSGAVTGFAALSASGTVIGAVTSLGNTSSNTTGITTQNTGSGTAHNNMQPTFILNKIIYSGA